MRRLSQYTTVVTPNGALFLAYAPAIEGCHALGATPEAARDELQNVFDMILEECDERGEALPPESQAPSEETSGRTSTR
ncbi:MAG: type II toxin-antitoxin system HicB family antitoxin [Dehalococcoidia bacterium]